MTENKKTIEQYMNAFNKLDHPLILSCLTDDVVWHIPGAFHIQRKEAFDKEIENDAFVGKPVVVTTRMVEEKDVVVAEGTVRVEKSAGGFLNLEFCDVFLMKNGKVK